jgi:hypothetical protein
VPARSLSNPYQGVNAHLHSLAQNPQRNPSIGTSLHASHIGHITDALNAVLPPHYIARSEQSLQIWSEEITTGDESSIGPRPDSAIFRTGTSSSARPEVAQREVDPTVRIISIRELLDEKDALIPSTVVYRLDAHEVVGEPVTRLELLSESNKKGGAGYLGYLRNRLTVLRSGASLIELDYLHRTPSPLPGIPAYPDEPDSSLRDQERIRAVIERAKRASASNH